MGGFHLGSGSKGPAGAALLLVLNWVENTLSAPVNEATVADFTVQDVNIFLTDGGNVVAAISHTSLLVDSHVREDIMGDSARHAFAVVELLDFELSGNVLLETELELSVGAVGFVVFGHVLDEVGLIEVGGKSGSC